MLILYTITIFLGAFLLFLVQPMAARAVLPLLGGSPSVWNTCMLFFQAALLGGYAYAHGVLRLRRTGAGVAVHTLVVLGAAAMLPAMHLASAGPGAPPATGSPVAWLLGALALSVGGPFFALSATGPLVQGWFSRGGHRHAADPYFLYAASNAGSMLALLAYPVAVEPLLPLGMQERVWAWGFLAFAAAMIACGLAAMRNSGFKIQGTRPDTGSLETAKGRSGAPSWWTRGRWVLLAFVPSSLMLGVTQYISTDIAPVPLLWVLPLAIYLLSFILVFGRRRGVPAWAWSWGMTVLVIGLSVGFLRGAREPAVLLIVLHLLAMLAGSMICHGRLAAERPEASRLTEFYLLIAVGGVLGGVFNAIVAPMVFTSVAEYPLVLAMACLFRTARHGVVEGASVVSTTRAGPRAAAQIWEGWGPRSGVGMDVAWAAVLVGLYWVLERIAAGVVPESVPAEVEMLLTIVLPIGAPIFVCYLFSRRNLRFALGLGAMLVFAQLYGARTGLGVEVLHAERTFFGSYRVESQRVEVLNARGLPEVDAATGLVKVETYHALFHGTTQHGLQNLAPEKRGVPLVYYHPKGPIGQVMEGLKGDPRTASIGLVGLGCGAMAAYAGEGQRLTFFEIDPAVVGIAEDTEYFSFLADARGRGAVIEQRVGDGRLTMAKGVDGAFGLLVLDAFSSDAIPVHLITVEAMELYLKKLAPGGVLVVHVSNRHMDLEPVLAAAAERLGLEGLIEEDLVTDEGELGQGRSPSTWVVMARARNDLAFLSRDARWRPLLPREGFRVWTDDFSNVWGIFR